MLVVVLKLPLALAVVGAPLTAIIGAQWLMLSVGGGMTSPMIVMRAFGIGAPLGLVSAWTLDTTFGFGAAGYLYGFAAGQLATLAILVQGVARAVPGDADEAARLAPAFREYRLLALSALAYYVSIWADKIVVYLVQGGTAATFYAAIAAVAWFSVIPAFAWIYVQIETSFYRRFRAFYADIEIGAPLRRLQQGAEEISTEARRILRGAGVVQASASGIAIAAAPFLVHAVGLSPNATPLFRLNAIGAAAQMITLLEVLLLYYFDLRRDALVISAGLLCSTVALTLLALAARLATGARLPPGLPGDLDVRRGAGPPPLEHAGARHVPVAAVRRVVSAGRAREIRARRQCRGRGELFAEADRCLQRATIERRVVEVDPDQRGGHQPATQMIEAPPAGVLGQRARFLDPRAGAPRWRARPAARGAAESGPLPAAPPPAPPRRPPPGSHGAESPSPGGARRPRAPARRARPARRQAPFP